MLAWLERNPFLAVALVGGPILGGLAVNDLTGSDPQPALLVQESAVASEGRMRVHVAGAVVSPGVYEFSDGARVEDAVAAAGGPVAGADLDSVNLARHLRDGEQILVEGAEAPAATAVVLTPGELLDLNTATPEQLDALPGIGEAYSRRIVDSRVVDGAFVSVDDLLARNLVPARTLEGIRAMVTVTTP